MGSSSISRAASWARARASTARWRSPPDSVCERASGQIVEVELLDGAIDDLEVDAALRPERSQVRRAAEQHVVLHGHRRWQLRPLGHVGHEPAACPAVEVVQRPAEQLDPPATRGDPAEGAQQR